MRNRNEQTTQWNRTHVRRVATWDTRKKGENADMKWNILRIRMIHEPTVARNNKSNERK